METLNNYFLQIDFKKKAIFLFSIILLFMNLKLFILMAFHIILSFHRVLLRKIPLEIELSTLTAVFVASFSHYLVGFLAGSALIISSLIIGRRLHLIHMNLVK